MPYLTSTGACLSVGRACDTAHGRRRRGLPDLLSELLAERDWLLADGATGTNLFDLGLDAHALQQRISIGLEA